MRRRNPQPEAIELAEVNLTDEQAQVEKLVRELKSVGERYLRDFPQKPDSNSIWDGVCHLFKTLGHNNQKQAIQLQTIELSAESTMQALLTQLVEILNPIALYDEGQLLSAIIKVLSQDDSIKKKCAAERQRVDDLEKDNDGGATIFFGGRHFISVLKEVIVELDRPSMGLT